MLRKFWNDENGAIISAELALVLTIVVIGVIVGLSEVAKAVNTELNDISNALGALDQSYGFTGYVGGNGRGGNGGKQTAFTHGTTWIDSPDDCDLNQTCDIVGGVAGGNTSEGGGGNGGGGWGGGGGGGWGGR